MAVMVLMVAEGMSLPIAISATDRGLQMLAPEDIIIAIMRSVVTFEGTLEGLAPEVLAMVLVAAEGMGLPIAISKGGQMLAPEDVPGSDVTFKGTVEGLAPG